MALKDGMEEAKMPTLISMADQVHGAADGVGGVAGGEHRGDVGDSDDGGDASAGYCE